ncbi:hypothetical protein SAV31267_010290 [Streptomyces avermitilis]|uniref:Aldehyde dehydrogenase domain-containing protein n=1 Tax=Streptomyces avermitilis TaxID=33903 RepID=A0A4D4MIL2_STRAX|nr:hypothetical protein SAVMC3_88010 [Streptomyces avermitilis]GDY71544.1 hypothetical protein SAV31267_010290 [Streptomyces avermitilis]
MSEIRTLRNYIDGEFVDAKDGRTLPVVDPTTGEVYASSPLSGRQTWTRRWQPRRRPFLCGATPPRAPGRGCS